MSKNLNKQITNTTSYSKNAEKLNFKKKYTRINFKSSRL